MNCLWAALRLWLSSRFKGVIWTRRSHSLRGLIPHFGYAESLGLRSARVIEYRPPKGKRWTSQDCVVCFRGEWIVAHYRLTAIRRWPTRAQAVADTKLQGE